MYMHLRIYMLIASPPPSCQSVFGTMIRTHIFMLSNEAEASTSSDIIALEANSDT